MKSWETEISLGGIFLWAGEEAERHLGFVFLYHIYVSFSLLYTSHF